MRRKQLAKKTRTNLGCVETYNLADSAAIFWDAIPCSLVEVYQCFDGMFFLFRVE
jgi:hypothetical protein